jgi:hypothetical protein
MLSKTQAIGAALAAALLATASASAAQDRPRSGRTAEEIARGIREAADAIVTVRDAYDQSIDGIRFGRYERQAIERCAPSVERYGRMRVQDVRRYGRRSLRVYGTVDSGGRYYGRSFTCTVRDDGRVKLKTKRRRY